MTEEDWEEMDVDNYLAGADEQFGEPHKVSLTRCKSGSTDHCSPAKRANKMVREHAKSEYELEKYHMGEWKKYSAVVIFELRLMHLFGCQHHLRNIGYGAGMRAVAAYLRPLLADTVKEAQEHGVQCVNGEVATGIRSILKFFGNTTQVHFLSVGSEFRQWCSEHDVWGKIEWLCSGRCDLGSRQDGAAEHSWMIQMRRCEHHHVCFNFIHHCCC